MNRFPQKVKDVIARRVNELCSNPACGAHTQMASDSGRGFVSCGKAAHIYAKSPGGPRFNSSLTDVEINSEKNGIWLCSVCHDLVDNDEKAYPPELLQSWKQRAERLSKVKFGRPIELGQNELVKAISTALEAEQQLLSNLDKDLNPKIVNVSPSGLRISLHPTKPKHLSLRVHHTSPDWFQRLEEGRTTKMVAEISGSPLFEFLAPNAVSVVLNHQEKPHVMGLFDGDSQIAVCKAKTILGTRFLRVLIDSEWTALIIELLIPRSGRKGSFSIDMAFDTMIGKGVGAAQELSIASRIIESMHNAAFNIRILKNGDFANLGHVIKISNPPNLPLDTKHILYLHELSKTSNISGLIVPESVSLEEIRDTFVCVQLLKSSAARFYVDNGMKLSFRGDPSFFRRAKKARKSIHLLMKFDEGEQQASVQGQAIPLPEHCVHWKGVRVSEVSETQVGDVSECLIRIAPSRPKGIEMIFAPGNEPEIPDHINDL